MKIIVVSQKTFLASRWEWHSWRPVQQWYRVQRAGTDWQRLEVKPRSLSIDEIQDSLSKRQPKQGSDED